MPVHCLVARKKVSCLSTHLRYFIRNFRSVVFKYQSVFPLFMPLEGTFLYNTGYYYV